MNDLTVKVMQLAGVGDLKRKSDLLDAYKREVLEWNLKVNLTAIPEELFDIKHFADSLIIASEECFTCANNIIDVGTGAGFPGVPLAIAFPKKNFTLLDSLKKRVDIIRQTVDKLGISNVRAIHARAEDLARLEEHREKYDLCVSRAVANLSTLSEYCLPFVRKGGCFAAYKGPESVEEIKDALYAVRILGGGEPASVIPRLAEILPDYQLDHVLVVISKIRITPNRFPRKAGTPSKDPLKLK